MTKIRKYGIPLLFGALTLFVACMIFNLGIYGFTSNQKIKVSSQGTYISGQNGVCEISVVDTKNHEPMEGKVEIGLYNSKKRSVGKLFKGRTDEAGMISANFEIPKVDKGDYYFKIKVSSKKGADKVMQKISISDQSLSSMVITLDKPLYKPGDEINYRVLMLNDKDYTPVKTTAKVTIADGNENMVYSKNIDSSDYGIISGKFVLADQVNSGNYKMKVEAGKSVLEKSFEVKPFTLPKFSVTIHTDKKEYLVGEEIKGKVNCKYYFGQPVNSSDATVTLNGQDPQILKFDQNGNAEFKYIVNGEGAQTIHASVIDSSKYKVEENYIVYAGDYPIMVKMVPESKELIPGIANEVFVFSTKIDGTPLKTYIALTNSLNKEISTDENGIAKFTITPLYSDSSRDRKYYIDAKIVDDAGTKTNQSFGIPVSHDNFGLIARPDRAIYSPNESINLDIASNIDGISTKLVAAKNGQILKVTRTAEDEVKLDLPKDTFGMIDIYAEKEGKFTEYPSYYQNDVKVSCWRSIFIKPDKNMSVSISKDNRTYKPGEDLKLSFDIKDNSGKPLDSSVMLSIADEALLSLKENDMKLDNLRLALSGIELGENYKGIDLYNVVLNNADPATLTALMAENSGAGFQLTDSIFDNEQKKEMALGNVFKMLWTCLIILAIYMLTRFQWFRFAIVHVLGFMCTCIVIFLVLLVFSNNRSYFMYDLVEGFMPLLISIFVIYVLIVRIIRGQTKEKATLHDPVSAGIALILITFLLLLGVMKYVMPMFNKSDTLSSRASGQIDSVVSSKSEGISPSSIVTDNIQMSSSAEAGIRSMAPSMPDISLNIFKNSNDQASKGAETNAVTYQQNGSQQKSKEDFAEITRLRNRFVESLYFNPQIIAKDGKASISIPMSDNITSWKIQAVANSTNGYLGNNNDTVKVFQDFFVDFELPRNLTVGDEVSIPVTVFNYLKNSQQVKLNVLDQDWFDMLQGNDKRISVKPGKQALQYIPIKVKKTGSFSFRVNAYGQTMSDAVEKNVKVYPNGYLMQEVCSSGQLDKKTDEKVFFINKFIDGTKKVKIKLYPAPVAQVVEGLENIIQLPSGCFEQTSSTLYPDILVLKYLKDSKKSEPKIEAIANKYIENGFQRLLTYEVKGQRGGFSLFGEAPAETVLSAYGLMEFNDLKEVYPVDQNLLDRTREFVFSKQKFDGTFKTEGSHLGGAGSSEELALNAYIGWALSEACPDDSRLDKTVEYLKKKAAGTDDGYTLALIANVLVNMKDKEANKIVSKLVKKIAVNNDKSSYLSSQVEDYFGARGSMQDLQATSLASMALSKSKLHTEVNKRLISYILSRKDASGTFGSTQATILALKALLANTKGAIEKDDTINISVNGVEKRIDLKANNPLSYYEEEFTNLAKDNSIVIKAKTNLAYEIVKEYYAPYEDVKEGNSFDVSRKLNERAKVNDQISEELTIGNKQSRQVKNMIATAQIPQGCTLDEASLEELKDSGVIEKYEFSNDKVNLYFRNFDPYETKRITIKYTARYPVDVLSGAVHIYDYYNPSVETKLKPVRIKVIS